MLWISHQSVRGSAGHSMTLSLKYTMEVMVLLSVCVTQEQKQEVMLVAVNGSHQGAVIA